MNPEPENFTELCRLLSLKRHEQPPPGYFLSFSTQVIARIRAGERLHEDSFVDWLPWPMPWLGRLWAALESKPVLAGAFGVAVCGLLLSGLILTERAEPILPSASVPEQALAHANPLFQPSERSDGGVTYQPPKSSLFQEFKEQRPLFVTPVVERQPYYAPGVN